MSMFAKRHYEFMARHMGGQLKYAAGFADSASRLAHYGEMLTDLTLALHRENPNFKPDRFVAAIHKAAKG